MELSYEAPSFTEWMVVNAIEALHGRRPSATQTKRWVREIDDSNGMVWGEFVEELMRSRRFATQVDRLSVEDRADRYYQFILGRRPDQPGLDLTIREMNAGNTAGRVAAMLVCAEAQALHRTLFAME